MTGVDGDGIMIVRATKPTRKDRWSPGVDELTGLGPEAERDGALVALHHRCRWSTVRLAALFRLSERQVFRVLADFDAELGGAD